MSFGVKISALKSRDDAILQACLKKTQVTAILHYKRPCLVNTIGGIPVDTSLRVDRRWLCGLALFGFILLASSCFVDPVIQTPSYAPVEKCDWSWQNPLPQGNHLRNISFTDANTGTAVGHYGTIIRTTDGGKTWVTQTCNMTCDFRSVSFTDADTKTVVGDYGTVLQSATCETD